MNKHMVGELTVLLLKEHHPYGQAYIWEFTVLSKEHQPYEQAYGWGVYSLIMKGAAPS